VINYCDNQLALVVAWYGSRKLYPDPSSILERERYGVEITFGQKAYTMPRFLSPTFFCVFVVVWTSVFLFVARLFLFSAHQVSSFTRN